MRAFAYAQGAKVAVTERRDHAGELAVQALHDGCELIVAVGGDGTMNEVARALLDTPATLGLVPCGSGDGLGRHLGIHGSPARAFDILLHGRARQIDSGVADGHPFFTAAGVGFEAEIAQRFNQLARRGFLRYLSTSIAAWRTWQPLELDVSHADRREHFRAFTLAVTNADQYGNDAHITPGALVDDGLLDLCAVPPVSLWNALPLAARLFHGTIARAPGIELRRSARFIVERPTAGLLHTDGEIHHAGPRIEFTIRPASLRIQCPA